jgi:citrate lyase subunit beta / citryl-CoA lyase
VGRRSAVCSPTTRPEEASIMGSLANRTAEGMGKARPRRSCLSVPGSSPKMLGKAPALAADEVFLDLEDSVAPGEKEAARGNVVDALRAGDWGDKTVVVRINAIDTRWAYRDVIEIVEAAGGHIDCIMIPKVQAPGDVEFVDNLLRMIEDTKGFDNQIGIEAQIENGPGLTLIDDIAHASERLETLIFGPGDMAAAMGMPSLTVGEMIDAYPGDYWHWIHMRILVAARTAGLQAIDGPYAKIRDLDGYREVATRTKILGYDGKWVLHPGQIDVANEVYAPTQAEYERAEDILEAYRRATDVDLTGAVMDGDEMIDEASRKMAEVTAMRGRAAGMKARPADEREG